MYTNKTTKPGNVCECDLFGDIALVESNKEKQYILWTVILCAIYIFNWILSFALKALFLVIACSKLAKEKNGCFETRSSKSFTEISCI